MGFLFICSTLVPWRWQLHEPEGRSSLRFAMLCALKFHKFGGETIKSAKGELLVKKSKAIDYIFTGDKIFITASKKSIYAVIDSL